MNDKLILDDAINSLRCHWCISPTSESAIRVMLSRHFIERLKGAKSIAKEVNLIVGIENPMTAELAVGGDFNHTYGVCVPLPGFYCYVYWDYMLCYEYNIYTHEVKKVGDCPMNISGVLSSVLEWPHNPISNRMTIDIKLLSSKIREVNELKDLLAKSGAGKQEPVEDGRPADSPERSPESSKNEAKRFVKPMGW